MDRINGIPIIYSQHAGNYKSKEVYRSWKERLFSRPWRPWLATKIISEFEPGIYRVSMPQHEFAAGFFSSPHNEMIVANSCFRDNIDETIATAEEVRKDPFGIYWP